MPNHTLNITQNSTTKKPANTPPLSIWLAEGQSSQRDMLASLQGLKPLYAGTPLTIFASHRSDRPEIFEFADKGFTEPASTSTLPRWQFVLEQAKKHQVKVVLTGRNSIDYEANREAFEQAGIRLLTGATSVDMLAKIDDKFAFIQHCQANDIPVASGWRFDTTDELLTLLAKHGNKPLCVKPVTGIFAQGFWRLDTGQDDTKQDRAQQYDSFTHLYDTNSRKISTTQFIHAYKNSQMVQQKPIPMLLMPYLAGREYSIDVICERGEVLGAITRYKEGKVQHLGYDKAVMAVVKPLIHTFGCDGIVSVQTKQDFEGTHRVLEINSRPSGGIGYTTHSGLDLTQVGFAYWLGLRDKPNPDVLAEQITPCQVRSIMVSVKI